METTKIYVPVFNRMAKECALGEHGIIIDQDNSFGNILDDLVLGVKNIKAICGEV